jgi:hypothetical protein
MAKKIQKDKQRSIKHTHKTKDRVTRTSQNRVWTQVFIWSNIPAAPAYGVYISQSIRYFRACGSYQDLLDWGLLLTRTLLNQWFRVNIVINPMISHEWGKDQEVFMTSRKYPWSFVHIYSITTSQVMVETVTTRSLVLCVCFIDRCLSFCIFLTIVLSVLRFTDSDYLFGIFKLLFIHHSII